MTIKPGDIINLNDTVEIKVTKMGRRVWKEYFDDLGIPAGKRERLARDGVMTMQLGDVMQKFGAHVSIGFDNPICMDVKIVRRAFE